MTDERHFSPAARYACLGHAPGDRWQDSESGEEHWKGRVGVETLLDAGATLEEPGDVRLPYYVEIGAYQPPSGKWKVSISEKRLDVREKDGIIDFVSTRSAVGSEVFDELEDAVEHACDSVEAFADAEVRDAREWWEERQKEREDDESTDEDDTTEDEQTEQQDLVTDGGRDAIVGSGVTHWKDQDECQDCGTDDAPLRAIKMVNNPRMMLCRDCFQTALEVGEVDPTDPRVEDDSR